MRFRRPKIGPESHIALEEATANLEQAKARTQEVLEVAQSLRLLRERNHFAEQLNIIMGGKIAGH